MRRVAITFLVLLTLLSISLIPISVQGSISLWPAKLNMSISEYPSEEIQYNKIRITNPHNYEIQVVSDIQNPSLDNLIDSYSYIPNLSWVKVSPNLLTIPANSYDYFTLTVDIPEDEKPLHLNEKWEVHLLVCRKIGSNDGNLIINLKLTSKILIHTPSDIKDQQVLYNPILILFIIGGAITFASVFLYIRKKRYMID